jgi:Peptidase family M49
MLRICLLCLILTLVLAACQDDKQSGAPTIQPSASPPHAGAAELPAEQPAPAQPSRFDIYATVRLTANLEALDESQKQMIVLLIKAAQVMDDLFWLQAYGDKNALLAGISAPAERRFAEINYGPWDRLAGDQAFIEGAGSKALGAQFYPQDMTKEEFEAWDQEGKNGLYTLVRRNEQGGLVLQAYSEAYQPQLAVAADLLRQAAELTSDGEFSNYLLMRAHALESDDYQASDMAWMDMKNNQVELVIGPIETYEDRLFGYRAAYEGYVLIKDMEWSARLARFAQFLPELQTGLPVADEYKKEVPGADADLNAYDVVFYAGHANAGGKTIAINLPNDEKVQLQKGTRRLQLKNAMLAKYNQILLPIANMLIADDQVEYTTFDAFFSNVMFHEVAHGLGIKNTLEGRTTVRQALKDHASAMEEGKADILGLYMVQKLREKGEITEGEIMQNYIAFMAGIFRSVRFGTSDAHGKANMICFNFFQQAGAFSRDEATGKYRINVPRFEQAVADLSRTLLTLQGDGNYDAVAAFVASQGNVEPQLQSDLDRLSAASIPVDVVFEQGAEVLGLQ